MKQVLGGIALIFGCLSTSAQSERITATMYKWVDANERVVVCTQIHYSSPCNVPLNTYAIREGHAGSITGNGDFVEDESSKQYPTRYLEYNHTNVRQLQPDETDASVLKIDESQIPQYSVATEVRKTLEADSQAIKIRVHEAEKKYEQSRLEQVRKQQELNNAAAANIASTAPAGPSGLTLRVLQSESVPYVQESRGSISTTCSITGNANTSAYVNSAGDSAYGRATTNWNQRMVCNSYDTTMRWPHVLNVMFVRASNGNSYIIACDRAWRWSHCSPLQAGDTFDARFTSKGIEVEAENAKGKALRLSYSILQSAVSR